jgi:hypothetical protein
MGEAGVVTRRSGRPVRLDGFSDAGSCCQRMANINTPVCFLREIKVAVGGDIRRRSYFLIMSASRRKMRALPVLISYFSRRVK